jgi:hypothetical protein
VSVPKRSFNQRIRRLSAWVFAIITVFQIVMAIVMRSYGAGFSACVFFLYFWLVII